jgi:hypothetical protein
MIFENAGCDPKTIYYNSLMAEQKVAKTFKNVFPIFIASEVVITYVEIQENERF